MVLAARVDAREAGVLALGLAGTAPVYLLAGLGLRVVAATDTSAGSTVARYVGTLFWTLLGAAAVMAALLLSGLVPGEARTTLALLAVMRTFDSLSSLSYGVFQRHLKTQLVGASLGGRGMLVLVVAGAAAFGSQSAATTAGVWAVIVVAWALLRDLPRAWRIDAAATTSCIRSVIKAARAWSVIRSVIRRALPLGLDASLSSLSLNLPRYAVQAYAGTAALGVFGVLTQGAFSAQMVIGAIGHTGVPRLAQSFRAGRMEAFARLYRRMVLTSVVIGAVVVAVAATVAPGLLDATLGREYADRTVLIWLGLATGAAGVQRTAGRAAQATGSFVAYLVYDVVITAVVAVAAAILVGPYGLSGAAASIAVGFLAGTLVTLWHGRRFFGRTA